MDVEKVKANFRQHGTSGSTLPPAKAVDVSRAYAEIEEWDDISLHEIAKEYAHKRRVRETSRTVGFIIERNIQIKCGNESDPTEEPGNPAAPLAEATMENVLRFCRPFGESLHDTNVADLDRKTALEIIHALFPSPTAYRTAISYIRPAFSLAVAAGWSPHNPLASTRTSRGGRKSVKERKIDTLSPDEVVHLFSLFVDHRDSDELPAHLRADCTPAMPAFVLLTFCGVRPYEVERLSWENIRMDARQLKIPAEASKTKTARTVWIAENAAQWLETVPTEERFGPIVCPNWTRIYKAVRNLSGLSQRQGDTLRHTYGTMLYGAGTPETEILMMMGHNTPRTTLRHYVQDANRIDATRFWSITPDGTEPAIRSTG